ncbi:MAG: RNA polymerase sigma factor [Myxococcota bacterium]
MVDEAGRIAERVARESYGRLVAFLAVDSRDVAGAEDALSEAFAAALRVWPIEGVPDNPDAWLLTAARRRQADVRRRKQTRRAGQEHLVLLGEEHDELAGGGEAIPDRRLALMFACAHTAIERSLRAPLILQTILGLTAEDIAAAFLVPPGTMGQRLSRAKIRIRDAGIPFRVPEAEELPERLAAVLDAIYAAYTKGWNEVADDGGPELVDEAIWLGHLLVELLPNEPEAKGMLALMLYTAARRRARRDATGAYVPLERQNIGDWDTSLIALAENLLRQANAAGPSGRYQLEAAIQSAHVFRRLTGNSNWPVVVALYDHLLKLTSSPVVILNRAVARAEVDGARAALADLAALEADKRMQTYQPYWAAKGHLLAAAGDVAAAKQALIIAIGLSTDEAVKEYLRRMLSSLPDS